MIEYRKEAVQNSKKDIFSLSIMIAEKLIGKELKGENKNNELLNMLMEEELMKKTNAVRNETF